MIKLLSSASPRNGLSIWGGISGLSWDVSGLGWVILLLELSILGQIQSSNGHSSSSPSLFEMFSGQTWNSIIGSNILSLVGVQEHGFFLSGFSSNSISDGRFSSLLAQFSKICSRESLSNLSKDIDINILVNWSLSKIGSQDRQSAWLVWQGDIN